MKRETPEIIMTKKSTIGHITPAGANIFAELGFTSDEAEQYLVESNEIIRQEIDRKAQLTQDMIRDAPIAYPSRDLEV